MAARGPRPCSWRPTPSATDSQGRPKGFFGTGVADEVLVTDNTAARNEEEEVRRTRPGLAVHVPLQGHTAWPIRRGFRSLTGTLASAPLARTARSFSDNCSRPEQRVRGGLRHPDHARAGLGPGLTMEWPALGQLGCREADGSPPQHKSHLEAGRLAGPYRLLKRPTARYVAARTAGKPRRRRDQAAPTILSGVRPVEVWRSIYRSVAPGYWSRSWRCCRIGRSRRSSATGDGPAPAAPAFTVYAEYQAAEDEVR